MLKILGATGLLRRLAAVISMAARSRPPAPDERPIAIVSPDDAGAVLYPYLFVDDDGSVRELHRHEKRFLETPFAAEDARRPYVKATYDQKNEGRTLRGYCPRSAIPKRLKIGYPPVEDPAVPSSSWHVIEQAQRSA